MAENTAIEWADHTFIHWFGCTKVSPGCDHCYAEASMDRRLHRVQWGAGQPRVRSKTWRDPKKWNDQHEAFYAQHGRRQRVFCASLADVFDNEVDPAWRMDLFSLIADTPHLDWLLLTKRIGNVMRMCTNDSLMFDMLSRNVWLGATIVDQEEADRDIPKLLAVPAAKRFLSMEPLLGPVDLTHIEVPRSVGVEVFDALAYDGDPGEDVELGTATIDWVIVGGESGRNARPMHTDWVRSLRDQCVAVGVPFLFKQWGHFLPAGQDGNPAHDPVEINASDAPVAVGKKAAGRLLDGRTWDETPA